jgi:hypothetical protein
MASAVPIEALATLRRRLAASRHRDKARPALHGNAAHRRNGRGRSLVTLPKCASRTDGI